jgi:hypothetical protein
MRLGLLANNNNNEYVLAHFNHMEATTLAHNL